MTRIVAVPHFALEHVKKAFPDMYKSPILPNQLSRTNVTKLHKPKSKKVQHQVRNKFSIKSKKIHTSLQAEFHQIC